MYRAIIITIRIIAIFMSIFFTSFGLFFLFVLEKDLKGFALILLQIAAITISGLLISDAISTRINENTEENMNENLED